MSNTSNLYGKVLKCTDLAFHFQPEGEDPLWIPFSQLEDPDEQHIRDSIGEDVDIEIPSWLAAKHDL